jgi:hypothetical protein
LAALELEPVMEDMVATASQKTATYSSLAHPMIVNLYPSIQEVEEVFF